MFPLMRIQLTAIGASKVALSSISSQELWAKSGRLANVGSEVCQISFAEGKVLLMTLISSSN